jgi:hypothetical protein
MKKLPLDWEREFTEKLTNQHLGRKAWVRLQHAGLVDFAKFLLYHYYAFGDSVPKEISKKDANAIKRLGAFKYAQRKAREREHDPKAERFNEKLRRKRDAFGEAEWPYKNPQVKTYADAAVTYPKIGSMQIEQAAGEMGAARQTLERYGGKLLLVILCAGAEARNIHLSLTELSELAYAAVDDADPLDKNTLQRFFAYDDIQLIEQAYLRQFNASEEWDLFSIGEAVKQEIGEIRRDRNFPEKPC